MRNDLTAGYVRSLLDLCVVTGTLTHRTRPGATRFNNRYAGMVAGSVGDEGYVVVSISPRYYKAHRINWFHFYGEWPAGEIDHINGVRHDNCLINLRDVTLQVNMQNQKRYATNASGAAGVYWASRNGKWCASIGVNGRQLHLGYYDDLDEAVAARKAAEVRYGFFKNHGRG